MASRTLGLYEGGKRAHWLTAIDGTDAIEENCALGDDGTSEDKGSFSDSAGVTVNVSDGSAKKRRFKKSQSKKGQNADELSDVETTVPTDSGVGRVQGFSSNLTVIRVARRWKNSADFRGFSRGE